MLLLDLMTYRVWIVANVNIAIYTLIIRLSVYLLTKPYSYMECQRSYILAHYYTSFGSEPIFWYINSTYKDGLLAIDTSYDLEILKLDRCYDL